MDEQKPDDPLNWAEDFHMTRAQASAYARAHGFQVAVSSLAKHAWRGDGPLISYFGAKPYYRVADFRAWFVARTRRARSTSRRRQTEASVPKDCPAGPDDP